MQKKIIIVNSILEEAYKEMVQDRVREQEAEEWIENLIVDL